MTITMNNQCITKRLKELRTGQCFKIPHEDNRPHMLLDEKNGELFQTVSLLSGVIHRSDGERQVIECNYVMQEIKG